MKLKGYTCPGCGGALIVDEALKVYRCEYCGVTYDYNYFMRDDVLERAFSYINHQEYRAAKEAFEFVLLKEPNNAIAYEGLLLTRAELRDLKMLRKTEVFEKLPYKDMKSIVDRALKNVEGDDRKFFEDFSKLLENGENYRATKKLQRANEKSVSNKEDKVDLLSNKATDKKENVLFRIIVQTICIYVVLGAILGIGAYFLLNCYHCYLTRGEIKAHNYVYDDEDDRSTRNLADWSFITEHRGTKYIGNNVVTFKTGEGDGFVIFYLRNGSTYFGILAIILAVIAVVILLIQLLRLRSHTKKLNLDDMYDQVKRIEADVQKDKNEYEINKRDANFIARDINKILNELIEIDPFITSR